MAELQVRGGGFVNTFCLNRCILSFGMFWTVCGVVVGQTNAKAPSASFARIAYFDVDASPGVGTPMAYDLTKGVQSPLRCRGVVLLGDEEPIVLCAVDWLGISNQTHEEFRERLAEAASTNPERVALHTLHQHDAPRCDGTAADLLRESHREVAFYDEALWERVMQNASVAIKHALTQTREVTHVAVSDAEVKGVASNRRLLDETGKVFATRYTACKDEALRALPEGVIDPMVSLLVFYHEAEPLVALSYYATHPQSYYRTGLANPDFPGMARARREAETGCPHIHFNGAGGNLGAGKYNDGSVAMRMELATRLAEGMRRAWERCEPSALSANEVVWESRTVLLPIAEHLQADLLRKTLADETVPALQVNLAAEQLAFVERMRAKKGVLVGCLKLPKAAVLSLPGELFVEYQLAAKAMKPEWRICAAAYADYGPAYIGTRAAYGQGGYETSPTASNVAPTVETVLIGTIHDLLECKVVPVLASEFTETVGPAKGPTR